MGLTLTVLGSSGTYAGPGNACSGYLLDDGTTRVWLDCGPGTLANLQRHVSLDELDAVVVSHSHPDHWLELPVLRNALRYGIGRSGLAVFGTADTLAKLDAALGDRAAPTFETHVIADQHAFAVGDLSFRCLRTDHPVETLAVRVESGALESGAPGSSANGRRTLVYSADTGPRWSPALFGPGIDLALIEATHLVAPDSGAVHLSAGQAGALAHEARAGRLLVTHIPPGADPEAHRLAAQAAFGGRVDIATMNERYEI